MNYGGIGAVIGHELSHGFDDSGSSLMVKAICVIGGPRWIVKNSSDVLRLGQTVHAYVMFVHEDMSVNGELTLGENIGDLGGMSVAYEAYRLSLGGSEAPIIDGLTGDQRFFLGWGQSWRRIYREAELRRRLIVDPHSPSQYRVNGIVRNIDAFYEAFNVKPGDKLYLEPEQRVRIW